MKLREFSSDFSITGLDFSKKMIEISKNHEYNIADVIKKDSNEIIQNNKNLQKESIQKSYDILVNDDFYNFSETKKPKYQFILAKGFLDYTYSLKKFFETSYNILDKKGQIILFSRCKIDDKVEIKLKKERSFPFYLVPYCHSEASIKNAAKNAKFEVISCEEFELESDVDANIFVIEKR